MYGILEAEHQEGATDEDIETSIENELKDMKSSDRTSAKERLFVPITTGIDCVFFMKILQPVNPLHLVMQICRDAKECADIRKRRCRYINRLTPVTESDKSTDNGLNRLVKAVLPSTFELRDMPLTVDDAPCQGQADAKATPGDQQAYTVSGDIPYSTQSALC